jgi:hypothetical protein
VQESRATTAKYPDLNQLVKAAFGCQIPVQFDHDRGFFQQQFPVVLWAEHGLEIAGNAVTMLAQFKAVFRDPLE